VIVTIDEPMEIVSHPDPAQRPGRFATIVGGLHASPALIRHPGRQAGVQIGLSPLGARTLLGLPAGELASIDVEAEALLGSWAVELRERVQAAATWPERFGAVDRALLQRFRAFEYGPRAPVAVGYAWGRMLATAGRVGVAELAGEIGWSSRIVQASPVVRHAD
jgi:hypothetical protein